jgi:hypothetical protein
MGHRIALDMEFLNLKSATVWAKNVMNASVFRSRRTVPSVLAATSAMAGRMHPDLPARHVDCLCHDNTEMYKNWLDWRAIRGWKADGAAGSKIVNPVT